jgi:hypothetical protein
MLCVVAHELTDRPKGILTVNTWTAGSTRTIPSATTRSSSRKTCPSAWPATPTSKSLCFLGAPAVTAAENHNYGPGLTEPEQHPGASPRAPRTHSSAVPELGYGDCTAASVAFPGWFRPVVVVRLLLATVGSVVVIVLLSLPQAGAHFR